MTQPDILALIETIKPLYQDLFQIVRGTECSTFCLHWGKKYPQEKNQGFLFVGRSANGWKDDNIASPDNTLGPILEKSLVEDHSMSWVGDAWQRKNNYNTNRSSFWRIIKKTYEAIYGQTEDWFEHIAWTNVMKFAPIESNRYINSLFSPQAVVSARKILEQEIKFLNPKVVLFITGEDWSNRFCDSIRDINWQKHQINTKYENEFYYHYVFNGTHIIQIERPEGKSEEDIVNKLKEIIIQITNKRNS